MASMTSQLDKAVSFRSAHHSATPLVLVNVWDSASARLAVTSGATAIATTSAGASWSRGFADGNGMPRQTALDVIATLAAAVDVPVSADIESGYGSSPAAVADTVCQVIAAGAVGINIEDGVADGTGSLRSVGEHAERIAAARAAADSVGVPLYVNARTDAYWFSVGAPAARLDESLARAEAYLAAGADGIFVPGVRDAGTITALTRGIPAPVNVLVGPGALGVEELSRLGVARVTVGSSLAAAAYGLVRRAVQELMSAGTYGELVGGVGYHDFNALMGQVS